MQRRSSRVASSAPACPPGPRHLSSGHPSERARGASSEDARSEEPGRTKDAGAYEVKEKKSRLGSDAHSMSEPKRRGKRGNRLVRKPCKR